MNHFLRFDRLVLVAVISGCLLWGRLLAQASGPTLSLPPALPALVGQRVTAPVAFRPGGAAVAGLTFSIDFDESCLSFDAGDQDGNGVLDSVRFTLPAAFHGSAAYAAADTDGELDIVIADYAPPIATLPSLDSVVAIDFTPLCSPPDNTPISAAIRFAQAPAASFGGVDGLDLLGATQDGAVLISLLAVATSTPTPTATATPSVPATITATTTPTATATAMATPSVPATVTATTTATATVTATPSVPATITATTTPTATVTLVPTTTPMATPTATVTLISTAIPNATATPLPSHQPLPLFLPLIRQD